MKEKQTTQKLSEIVKESNTPALDIENTHSSLPIDNEQIQSGVIYDASLENTLNMKDNVGFFNVEETDDGDNFWNGFPIEKFGGNKLKTNQEVHNITPGIRMKHLIYLRKN